MPPLNDVVEVVDADPYWTMLDERFGIPRSTFGGYALVKPGSKKLYIIPEGHVPPARPDADTVGMSFMRIKMSVPKLTTAAAMHFGSAATRNVVDATPAQAEAYLTQQNFEASANQLQRCTGRGYVLVRHRGWTLGVGFLQARGKGVVRSMFPSGFARDEAAFSLTD